MASLDATTLFISMGAGALFALSGLWLIFRPKAEAGTAKIDLLGVKFESSLAGVPVVLIGAALLAATLCTGFADGEGSDDPAAPQTDGAQPKSAADAGVQTATPRPARVETDIVRPIAAVGHDQEPNNTIVEANEIAVGSLIHGEVGEGEMDWCSVTCPPDFVGEFAVNSSSGSRSIGFVIHDELGAETHQVRPSKRQVSPEVRETYYTVGVWTRDR